MFMPLDWPYYNLCKTISFHFIHFISILYTHNTYTTLSHTCICMSFTMLLPKFQIVHVDSDATVHTTRTIICLTHLMTNDSRYDIIITHIPTICLRVYNKSTELR